MHKIYTCKYFGIWSKYILVSKSIFTLRSHANSVHICILKVHTLVMGHLYFDNRHVHTNRGGSCHIIYTLVLHLGCLMKKMNERAISLVVI